MQKETQVRNNDRLISFCSGMWVFDVNANAGAGQLIPKS
jgi:hypothetical protein